MVASQVYHWLHMLLSFPLNQSPTSDDLSCDVFTRRKDYLGLSRIQLTPHGGVSPYWACIKKKVFPNRNHYRYRGITPIRSGLVTVEEATFYILAQYPRNSLAFSCHYPQIYRHGQSQIFRMRSLLTLSTLLPLILACTNPDSDPCASAFTASSAAAASFCKTYTTAKSTATTGLPAFVSSYCSTKTAKASAACSCLVVGTGVATTSSATTLKTTTTSIVSLFNVRGFILGNSDFT